MFGKLGWASTASEMLASFITLMLCFLLGGEWAGYAFMIYGLIGSMVCQFSDRIPMPEPESISLRWGFTFLWWEMWWPYFVWQNAKAGKR